MQVCVLLKLLPVQVLQYVYQKQNLPNLTYWDTRRSTISNRKTPLIYIFTARKRSYGKVMFLQVSVILLTGGWGVGIPSCLASPRMENPAPPPGMEKPPLRRSMCGRYASYWNAFLLLSGQLMVCRCQDYKRCHFWGLKECLDGIEKTLDNLYYKKDKCR